MVILLREDIQVINTPFAAIVDSAKNTRFKCKAFCPDRNRNNIMYNVDLYELTIDLNLLTCVASNHMHLYSIIYMYVCFSILCYLFHCTLSEYRYTLVNIMTSQENTIKGLQCCDFNEMI